MGSHITQVHNENVNKVPNAPPGFGMQGVPKHLIDERVLAGAAAYWNRSDKNKETKSKRKQPPKRKKKENGQKKQVFKPYEHTMQANNNGLDQGMSFNPNNPIQIQFNQPLSFAMGGSFGAKPAQ